MLYKHAVEDSLGVTALMWAASKGHEPLIRLLLEKGAAGVNDRDDEGLTALHRAASEGHIEIIESFLKHCADIHARTDDFSTVLHWAVTSRSEDVVRLIIKSSFNGKEIDFQNFEGSVYSQRYRGTALHWAVIGGHEGVARVLLEEGADKNLKDNTGRIAIFWAVEFGYGGLCRMFLMDGFDSNVRDNFGSTIFELAESAENDEIVRLLKAY
ncbi:uncharacterized protein LAJ45_00763 [Morchella importuna]|uniref:uncharacterized protein n=1 Tax=Morchella importuna TaxID=1174673 RepID=UPI001E8ECD3A|nr:uncharacterized protein LAJ45_00763 [Morchella importuna]KAH8155753.1 hypothetical protein LAJ45_00763 [Morchella importuna]